VLPFASRGGFHFDARLFSIESIDHSENQSHDRAEKKVVASDRDGGNQSKSEPEQGDLVRRDGGSAEKRDDACLDRRMEKRGQVESSVLRCTKEKPFRVLVLVRRGSGKTEGAEMPPHANDVGGLGGCVDCLNRVVFPCLEKLVGQWSGGR